MLDVPTVKGQKGRGDYNLIVLPSHPELGLGVAARLHHAPLPVEFAQFGDRERYHRLMASTEGAPTFVVGSTRHTEDLHSDIFDLYNLGRTLSRSVRDIYAIFPHIPYLTQERIDKTRACLSAAAMFRLIENAGYSHLVTLDMHSPSLETALGVGNLMFDHFLPTPIFSAFISGLARSRSALSKFKIFDLSAAREGDPDPQVRVIDPNDLIIGATDLGGMKRAGRLAEQAVGKKRAHNAVAVAIKDRDPDNGAIKLSRVIGPALKGRDVVLVDDLLRSFKTFGVAARAMKDEGARRILGLVTTPEMNDGAEVLYEQALSSGTLSMLAVTNSCQIPAKKRIPGLTQILLDPIMAAVIEAKASRRPGSASSAFHEAIARGLEVIQYI
jgi:ribose-phosphate pyrophosphokinase